MAKFDEKKVAQVIVKNVALNKGEWPEIGAAITEAGLAPKNWMRVRSVVQHLINQGFIVRTDSIHEERYVLTAYAKKALGV